MKGTIREQFEEIARLKALIQADEKCRGIEALKTKEAEYKKQLAEKDHMIAEKDQMIAFQKEILSGLGVQ